MNNQDPNEINKKCRTIKVDYLARVEGEGALWIDIENDRVKDVKLKIFEPPRFFEALLRGRDHREAIDITARICGICPVAYQMSAVHAMERIMDIKIPESFRQLRRLMYCGEWIESHGLHVFMLHAPDFLGYQDAIQMAKDHGEIVRLGLELKKIGNELVRIVGGREIHPINVKVGGFYRLPKVEDLKAILPKIEWGLKEIHKAIDWAGNLNFQGFKMDYEFVSLRHEQEYPLNEGRIISNRGLSISVGDFEKNFEEIHVQHTNALHCVKRENYSTYFVGPMARFNLNFDKLPSWLQQKALAVGLALPCQNPFQSILIRLIEIAFAFDEAQRNINQWKSPGESEVSYNIKPGIGWAATEAPRGLLYHRYEIGEEGQIKVARIIPPTSQNQRQIERDLYEFIPQHLNLDQDSLTRRCEQAVRNYDPCISCATHFLKVHVNRDSLC